MLTIIVATMLQGNNLKNEINTLKQNKDVVIKTFTKKANAINYIKNKNLKNKPVVKVKSPKTQTLHKTIFKPISKILNYSDIIGGSYNKGFKYYSRFIYRRTHIRSTQLLQKLNIQLPSQLKPLFSNNAQELVNKLNQIGGKYKRIARSVKRIAKKHKLNDLYKFLEGILNGKIPASCG